MYSKDFFTGVFCLMFFGGGGVMYFLIQKEDPSQKIANGVKVIYESRKRVLIFFLGSLIFVICGMMMIINNHYFNGFKSNPSFALFAGFLSVSFFGIITFYTLMSIIKPKKIIEVNENGIFVQSGFLKSLIFVEWRDISEIVETNFMSNSFISIFIKNPSKYARKYSFIDVLNSKLIGTSLNINPKVTSYSSVELLNFLNNKLKENKN